jgi:cellulose synthase/poly-beta-1,6-N-acetylglucosamine synthase-like glycosyltransferase
MTAFLTILWYLYLLLQVFLASFLIQPFILLLLYTIAKAFSRRKKETAPQKNYQFAIIITSHQDTTFLRPIVDSLQRQLYPHFNAYVVADDCDISDLHFDDPRIHLLRPAEPLHSKTKSIRYALERFQDTDEVLVIFDPDNLVHPRFLQVLNARYNKGYRAVQGNLSSKNTESAYGKMDSIGAIFNTFIDRDSRTALGLSVNIWGTGVSVDRRLYQEIIYDSRSQVGGFDKRMQAEIAKRVHRIGYAADAILYDEKVEDGENLERQRNRWIRAYFKFLAEAFDLFLFGLKKFSFNLAYFGYNLTRPPYFLQILSALFFIVLNFFISKWLCLAWIISLGLFALSFIVIGMTQGKNSSKGVWYMPLFFYHQVKSFFRLGRSKHSFLKTGHSKILYIDDLLKHDPGN